MYDVRAVANHVLDVASSRGIDVTNMALNKIVYFVHCDYLMETAKPLVSAKIEAWEHGPVFREVYHEFKRWSDAPIRSRATKIDPDSGDVGMARLDPNEADLSDLTRLVDRYLGFLSARDAAYPLIADWLKTRKGKPNLRPFDGEDDHPRLDLPPPPPPSGK